MDIRFSTYNDFLTEYQTYKLDKCSNCEGMRELIDDDVTVVIENRTLHFPELLVLCCNKCGDKCLPEYSKQIIDGAYKSMIEQEQFVGEFLVTLDGSEVFRSDIVAREDIRRMSFGMYLLRILGEIIAF